MPRREPAVGRRRRAMPDGRFLALTLLSVLVVALLAPALVAGASGTPTRGGAVRETPGLRAPAPEELEVTVTTNRSSGEVGQRVSVAVTVSGCPGAEPTPTVEGANAGAELTREGGGWTYVGTRAGEDRIVAALTTPAGYSDTGQATVTWAPTISLAPASSQSTIGRPVTLEYTTRGVDGADVTARVSGANGGASVTVDPTSEDTGDVFYTGRRAGTDTVEVSVDGPTGPVTATATVSWAPITVELTRTPGGEIEQGSTFTLVATVTGAEGGEVVFEPDDRGDRRAGAASREPVGEGGRATREVEAWWEGDRTFWAEYHPSDPALDVVESNRVTVTVVPPPPPPIEVRLTAPEAVHIRNQAYLSATPSRPVTAVSFVATRKDGATVTVAGTADGDTWYGSYSRTTEGTDTVVAVATDGDVRGESSGRSISWYAIGRLPEGGNVVEVRPVSSLHRAVPAPVSSGTGTCGLLLEVGPDGTSSGVDAPFSVSVSVTESGRPVTREAVAVRAVGLDGAPDEAFTVTTGDDGEGSSAYRREDSGVDAVTASVTVGGVPLSASIAHTWVADPEEQELLVTLGPVDVTTLTGSPFTTTAVVTERDGTPVEGATVDFRVVMEDQPDQEVRDLTDADGVATFTYTRRVAGTEQIIARVRDGEREGLAAIGHAWVTEPGLTFTIGPDQASSVVSSRFTATATLRSDGEPVPRARLDFLAEMPDVPPLRDTVRTREDGTAPFTWTRPTTGTDQLTATYTTGDGVEVHAALVHIWKSAPPPDGVDADLEVEVGTYPPGADVGASGSGCTEVRDVTVTLSGEEVGTAVADRAGRYELVFAVPLDAELADHQVAATCGQLVTEDVVSVARPVAETATPMASVVTASAVMVFFLLLGSQVVRFADGSSPTSPA